MFDQLLIWMITLQQLHQILVILFIVILMSPRITLTTHVRRAVKHVIIILTHCLVNLLTIVTLYITSIVEGVDMANDDFNHIGEI